MKKFILLQAIIFAFLANLTFAQSPTWTHQQYIDWQKTNPVVSNKAVQTNTPKDRAEGGPSSVWYFGTNAGLDFKTEPPTPLLDGQIVTNEGCAVISDADGNLMFYTDGMTVWTKTHVAMPNGTGLLGNPSTTQSGIIVPLPGSSTLFYVFAVAAYSASSVSYSIVDITLNSGLGDVTTKNTSLLSSSLEGVNAIKATNGDYWWIIMHNVGTSFYAYKLESTGINTTPVITDLGFNSSVDVGYLKANATGTKVASSYDIQGKVQILDFDASTGVFSNLFEIAQPNAYGCEFSPNGNLLYVADEGGSLIQYDLTNGNAAFTVSSGTADMALQVAPNGKIYIAKYGATALNVINDPNVVGAGCNYATAAQDLGGRTSTLGLPTFISAYAAPNVDEPPTGLTYNPNPNTGYVGTAITPSVPSTTGGDPVESYSISGTLPAGLIIDASTGIISGTPTETSVATDYTVTATNAGGSTTCVVNITVLEPAGPCDNLAGVSDVFTVNTETCVVSAGEDVTYLLGASGQFNATNADFYSWSPTTGLNNANIANPTVTGGAEGSVTTYTVTGYTIKDNLIVNGDFELGNQDFTSDYTVATDLTPEGTYAVGTSPTTFHSGFSNCTDHTSGTGNMMVVNGSTTVGKSFTPSPENRQMVYDAYVKAVNDKKAMIMSDATLYQQALATGWFEQMEIGLKNAELYRDGKGGEKLAGTCETAEPFCTAEGTTYPAGINTTAQAGPAYGCLGAQPNPVWYYMKVLTGGVLNITETNSANLDVDFILWGPFTSQNICGELTADKIVDCSFSGVAVEYIDIASCQAGEYYMLLITNFSNQPTDITLAKTGGSAETDCGIVNPTTGGNIWAQTVEVEPNTNYAFSAYVTTVVASNPPVLQFSIGGELVGEPTTFPNTTCSWTNFYHMWNSGENTSVEIIITNQNTVAEGNDFAIDDITFTRLCTSTDDVTATVNARPTVQASALEITNIQLNQFDVSWTRGDGDKCATFIYQGSEGQAAPVDATEYTANTIFASGTQIGTTGWYCIYNGTETDVTVTGLTENTIYRVMVIEYNDETTAPLYLLATATNNPANARTLKTMTTEDIPNVMTPNGDGYNDFWVIEYLESLAGYNVTIYNNIEGVIYKSENYDNTWDGTFNGKPVTGTYYYKFVKGDHVIQGFITIL